MADPYAEENQFWVLRRSSGPTRWCQSIWQWAFA